MNGNARWQKLMEWLATTENDRDGKFYYELMKKIAEISEDKQCPI